MTKSKLAASACLCGIPCRYDGRENTVQFLKDAYEKGEILAICPEVMGGLPTPRCPSEIKVVNGKRKVYNSDGKDLTLEFVTGAALALQAVQEAGISTAVLKAKSPSCGIGYVYDGTFGKRLTTGDGIAAKLFMDAGIKVIEEGIYKSTQEINMNEKIHLGVVFGGQSGEHEVSCVSAYNILQVINQQKYEITTIGITKDGQIFRYSGEYEKIKNGTWLLDTEHLNGDMDFWRDPLLKEIDIYFPVLHGPMGEDGTIQGLFELINKPYVGCGVLASAIGMDKHFSKIAFEAANIPTGAYKIFRKNDWNRSNSTILKMLESAFDYPIFIKPANMGSSVGISKVHNQEELIAGIGEAFIYDDKIIAEAFVDGREIECAVLEENGDVKASIPGEIIASKEFYDYEAKYGEGQTSQILIPAQLPEEVLEKIRDYAVKAFQAIEGTGLSRVDFFVTRDENQILINEVNTLPGFTPISMYSKMWEKTGINYEDLVEKLIKSATRKRKTVLIEA